MTDQIEKLLQAKFEEPEYQDCFLVDLKLSPSKKLEVFVDSDSGMTLQKCQKISRYLESFIDSNEWLGEAYTIEVSSPGVGRPLKLWRQYRKNIGRELEVSLKTGDAIEGQLVEVGENAITLEAKMPVEGKKKKELKTLELDLGQIKKAVVKVSFK